MCVCAYVCVGEGEWRWLVVCSCDFIKLSTTGRGWKGSAGSGWGQLNLFCNCHFWGSLIFRLVLLYLDAFLVEEGAQAPICTYAYWETYGIPLPMRNEAILDEYICWRFCCRLSSMLLLFAITNQQQINNMWSYGDHVSSCSHDTLVSHGLFCQHYVQYFHLLILHKILLAQFRYAYLE